MKLFSRTMLCMLLCIGMLNMVPGALASSADGITVVCKPVDGDVGDVYLQKGNSSINVGSINMMESYTDYEHEMYLYRLDSGNYFYCCYYGPGQGAACFRTLSYEDGGWKQLRALEDPGYTDGVGLRDPDTYEDVTYFTDDQMPEDVDAWMDDEFNAYFAEDGVTFSDARQANVPGELIIQMDRDQIISGEQSAETESGTNPKTEFISSKKQSSDDDTETGYVQVTGGSINVRSGPGLAYDTLGNASEGTTLEFQGETSTDDRGVVWYKVVYKGMDAWVSSKYTEVRN